MKKVFLLFMILGLTSISLIDINGYGYNDPLSGEYIENIDTPIYYLNNYSLREIYEFFNELNDFYSFPTWTLQNVGFISYEYDILTLIGLTNKSEGFLYYEPDITVSSNEKIYVRYNWDSEIPNTELVLFYNVGLDAINTTDRNASNIFTVPNGINSINQVRFDINNNYSNDIQLTLKSPVLINLNGLNFQNLSIDILDYYYDLYVILKYGIDPTQFYLQGSTDGYNNGFLDGELEGYNRGYSEGLSDGYINGYDNGLLDGYDNGYIVGDTEGYLRGYDYGFNDGVIEEVDTQWLLGFVSGTVNILGVSIIPGISLGVFVFIPLFLGFIGFIFRLGGRRG